MQQANFFWVFLERLNHTNIDYMITGSVASIIYGEPRITHDIDLVLELKPDNILEFINTFPSNEFYCPPQNVIEQELSKSKNGHFNVIHHKSGFKADIYFFDDELSRWGRKNRNEVEMYGSRIWIAPPEYVIVRKLEYYKEGGSSKHLQDIKSILNLSNTLIDRQILNIKIEEQGYGDVWKEIK